MNTPKHRNKFLMGLTTSIVWPVVKTTSHKIFDIQSETQELLKEQNKNKNCSLFFISTHKSMWETVGIPFTIRKFHGDVPYAFIGNNLIKKETGKREQLIKYVTEQIGGVWVERENNVLSATPSLISNIETILSNNRNAMLFPETTRSRNGLVKEFKPAGFQGAINAANHADVYIIPCNTDYSILFEIDDFIKKNQKTYTFKAKDFRKWRTTYLDDIYISFGKPIPVSPTAERKELAQYTRDACLDLVKILPVNILSQAILQLNAPEQQIYHQEQLEVAIETIMKQLENKQEKFQGFTVHTPPHKIMERAKQKINHKLIPAYNIYANYIDHYLK